MANTFYTPHLNKLLHGDIDYDTMKIKADLVDSGAYTVSAAHATRASINTGGAVIAASGELTPTITNATIDTPDFTFTAVSGTSVEAIVFYVGNTGGADSAWYPIVYIDTPTSGLALTPNGQDVNVTVTDLFTL